MSGRQARIEDATGTPSTPFLVHGDFVEHPYLKPQTVQARSYQTRLAERALRQNTLIVLPTGLGKTIVAALAIAETLRTRPGTILLLAPTRPLSLQHQQTFQRLLRDEGLIQQFSGELTPKQREAAWGRGILVTATPQTIRNDLAAERYDLSQVSLLIVDEAHRAVGDYAYVEIAKRHRADNPGGRLLGLTASPGAKQERVGEVAKNLSVEVIESRDAESEDVQPYVQRVEPEILKVPLTPILRSLQQELQTVLAEQEAKLRQQQLVRGQRTYGVTKRELIAITQGLGRQLSRGGGGPLFGALLAAQKALYTTICLEYLETQGLVPLKRYLDRLRDKAQPKRAEKSFLADPRITRLHERLGKGIEVSHPKIDAAVRVLRETVAKKADALVLVFAQYRDTVASLEESFRGAGFKADHLVGQAARGEEAGQDQSEQADVLRRFGAREFNVLVATSVGEEGLDIPQVDLVVFFEAVPSEIRAVQRRGRTGRTVAGRVVVLVAENTRDEAYLRAQTAREGKMKGLISRFS